MKQLSIRLLAPSINTEGISNRVVNFSAKKMNLVLTTPLRIVGKWRLYMNYCPECNSCAPKLHHCEVCNADTKSYFQWSDDVKKAWWKKFTDKHRIAV